MLQRPHLLLPLVSSVIYVLGALLVRRAADLGVGLWVHDGFVEEIDFRSLFYP